MNCRLTENTISITDTSHYSWWQVSLHSLSQVKSIVIYNRDDCCSDQLSHATIYVKMTNRYAPQFNNTGDMKGVRVREFTGERSFFGRTVKIEKNYSDVPLSLCEVEVYGKTGLNLIFLILLQVRQSKL